MAVLNIETVGGILKGRRIQGPQTFVSIST